MYYEWPVDAKEFIGSSYTKWELCIEVKLISFSLLMRKEETNGKYTKKLRKTPLGKLPSGSLVRVGECKKQPVINCWKTHPDRDCGNGLFISVW